MDIELLEKFLQGRCTADEAAVVRASLDKDPAILEAYLREAGEVAALGPVGERMPVEMEAALLRAVPRRRNAGRAPVIRRGVWWPAAAAAVLIGLVVTGWMAGIFGSGHAYILLEATASIKQVKLADGSTLWLRPGSRVRFDQRLFGAKERSIELQRGEVFFDVVHNAASPFIVRSGSVRTEDVGTSFDVDAASGEVKVIVATGEVKVLHEQKELGHLLPGSQMNIAATTGKYTLRVLPAWMASIWKENTIQLKNVPFNELAMAIQELYGIRLQTVEDRISKQTFTMQLSRQTPGEQVIKVICLFNQNQYRKRADGSYLIF